MSWRDEPTIEEQIMESAWNACKMYYTINRTVDREHLTSYVHTTIALEYGDERADTYRDEWQGEVDIFCSKYAIH